MRTDLALAALASAAVPGMKPVSVAGIAPTDEGRGSELQSALVEDATGRRWVVRAPLTPVAGARLQRNDELVRQLSRHVPFKVPAAVGYAALGKEGSAAVYPYVEGSPLDLRRLPGGPGLASAVGRAVAAIHNIPRALFEEQDVPVFDASGCRQRAIAEVDRAAETGRVPTGLLARWEEAFEAAPLWQFATTPVHGAFSGDSVVVAFTDEEDAASGRVVAVTDWDEAMVGDPAVDLAELWAQTSRQAWDAVLDSYTLARAHRPDAYLHARARLVAEMRSLRGLARAVAEDDEDAARRAVEVLRRVDRLTEADDSLVPVTARSTGARPAPGPQGSGAAAPAGASADGADLTMEVPAPTAPGPDHPPVAHGSAGAGTAAVSEEEDDGRVGSPTAGRLGDLRVEDRADEDATVQIALGADDGPGTGVAAPARSDEPSPVVSEATDIARATDGTTVDLPVSGTTTGDPLAHDPVPPPGDPDEPEQPAPQDEPEQPAPQDEPGGREEPGGEPDDLHDDERLHELYGMPSPERDADDR